jgi:hypothetical protein
VVIFQDQRTLSVSFLNYSHRKLFSISISINRPIPTPFELTNRFSACLPPVDHCHPESSSGSKRRASRVPNSVQLKAFGIRFEAHLQLDAPDEYHLRLTSKNNNELNFDTILLCPTADTLLDLHIPLSLQKALSPKWVSSPVKTSPIL